MATFTFAVQKRSQMNSALPLNIDESHLNMDFIHNIHSSQKLLRN